MNESATDERSASYSAAHALLSTLIDDSTYEPSEAQLVALGKWRNLLQPLLDVPAAERTKALTDALASGKLKELLTPAAAPAPDAERWHEPIPLELQSCAAEFPIDALPRWLAHFVRELSISTQTPPAMPGMLALAVLSTALQRKAVLELKSDWSEPLNLYCLVALPSGSRKSAVVSALSKPIEAYERELQASAAPEIADKQSQRRSKELELGRLEKKCADAPASERSLLDSERRELARELATEPEAALPELLIGDSTPEALASKLAEQQGKLAMLSAEAGLLETITRYVGAGAQPNIDVLLNAHMAETVRIDRKSRTERIEQPALTIGAAVQPSVLTNLAANSVLRSRGLIARFLIAVPESNLGYREIEPPAMRASTKHEYAQQLGKLLRSVSTPDASAVQLELVPAAYELLSRFRSELEPQYRADAPLAEIADWCSKLPGAIARIAALLHIAEHGYTSVQPDAMRRALIIGNWLLEHGKIAFGVMNAAAEHAGALRILRWLRSAERTSFKKRELLAGVRGSFKSARALDAPLELLCELGYLRKEFVPITRAGRPPEQYAVNPAIYTHQAHADEHQADEHQADEPSAASYTPVPDEHQAEPAPEEPYEEPYEHQAEPSADELAQLLADENARRKQMIANFTARAAQQQGATV